MHGERDRRAIEFDRIKQKLRPAFTPSRLFIYYNERVMEGTVDSDSAPDTATASRASRLGAPPNHSGPTDITKFRDKPPASDYSTASKYTIVLYQRLVQTVNQMKGCLASGFPFVLGFARVREFQKEDTVAKTGIVPMPTAKESVIGGHAVLAVGYDDTKKTSVPGANSWGPDWGMTKGYFTMPYAYLSDSNLADDFWTIRLTK